MAFHTGEIIDESLRTMRARRGRTTLTAVVVALLGAAVMVLTHLDVGSSLDAWHAQRVAGSDVIVASPLNPEADGGLSVARCDAARQIAGVESAGAILTSSETFSPTAPMTEFSLFHVTPGFAAVAYPGTPVPASSAVIAGSGISETLGLRDGSAIRLDGAAGLDRISTAARGPALREPWNGAIMVSATPVGETYDCLVAAIPGAQRAVVDALSDWFAPHQVSLSTELQASDLRTSPDTLLRERATQFVAPAIGVVVSILILAGWLMRRGSFACYRALGAGRGQVLLMLSIESAVLVWVPLAVGLAAGIAVPAWTGTDVGHALTSSLARDVISLSAVVALLPPLGMIALTRHSPFDISKGR